MQKSNLIRSLRCLDKRDWRAFRKFVRSPYFNQREDVIRLFDYLDEMLGALKVENLDRKLVFKAVYGMETFEEQKLRHTSSVLLKLLKKYLVQLELEKDKMQHQAYLCKAYRQKSLDTFFEKALLQGRQDLEKETYRDSAFYYKHFEWAMEEAVFTVSYRRNEHKQFQTIADHLSISFIANLLRLKCEIQSHQTMSEQVYNLQLLPKVLKLLAAGEYLDIPIVALYYHCYSAFDALEQNEVVLSEKHFHSLKELIHTHWTLIPPIEIRDIYLYAINYCIKRLNSGDRHFIREAFELFRSGLSNETLLEEGILSSFTYKNITRLGMALQEDEWVASFLENHKKHLHPRERENTWRYNLAFFYFQKQKYQQAMQLLVQTEFKDVLNNLDARRMLLKSYFELGEYNALDSLLDSFSRYIHRQDQLGYHRENYTNLIRFVKKIIHNQPKDKKLLTQVKQEIKATNRLAEREWLLEKVDTLG